MGKSRLKRKQVRSAKRNLYLMLAGASVILIVGIVYGPQLLINFSIAIENLRHPSAASLSTNTSSSSNYVAPPSLNPLETATNSASTSVSGYALAGQTVKLYVNGSETDQMEAGQDGSFTFKTVALSQGTNTIKAKAVTKNHNQSSFSNLLTISYLSQKPTLTVDQPQDGQHFSHDSQTVQVGGKTDPQDRVTVNGFWAIIDDQGNYSYLLPLQNGDNTITVVSTDQAGNTTSKTIKVTRDS